jgi:hypothetical protein
MDEQCTTEPEVEENLDGEAASKRLYHLVALFERAVISVICFVVLFNSSIEPV